MSILFNVWMLPILFILHDFEEIIFMPLWKTRHHQKLETFKKPFFGSVTQGSAFAVGVFEEFMSNDSQHRTLFSFCNSLYSSFHNPLYHVPAIWGLCSWSRHGNPRIANGSNDYFPLLAF